MIPLVGGDEVFPFDRHEYHQEGPKDAPRRAKNISLRCLFGSLARGDRVTWYIANETSPCPMGDEILACLRDL